MKFRDKKLLNLDEPPLIHSFFKHSLLPITSWVLNLGDRRLGGEKIGKVHCGVYNVLPLITNTYMYVLSGNTASSWEAEGEG